MPARRDATTVEAAGREVEITSPGKVFFPQRGETKLDLVRYYLALEGPVMAAMGGRPTLMQRFPSGVKGTNFFQKRVPDNAPEWLDTTVVRTVNGTPSRAMVAADIAHVIWAVNLGCLGFHVWPFQADTSGEQAEPSSQPTRGDLAGEHQLDGSAEWVYVDEERCDELRLDLDPQPGTGFGEAVQAAFVLRDLLAEHGITGYPKTTGNRGLHVYVRVEPRWNAYQVRAAAVAVARELERRRPDLITAAWWKEERGTRIFVDYNQNAPHKTVFGAWSVRARVGAPVSTPLSWDELTDVHPDDLTIASVPGRVERDGDPWAGIAEAPQPLEPLLAMSERDMAAGLMDAPWPPVYPKMPNEPPRVAPSRARAPDS